MHTSHSLRLPHKHMACAQGHEPHNLPRCGEAAPTPCSAARRSQSTTPRAQPASLISYLPMIFLRRLCRGIPSSRPPPPLAEPQASHRLSSKAVLIPRSRYLRLPRAACARSPTPHLENFLIFSAGQPPLRSAGWPKLCWLAITSHHLHIAPRFPPFAPTCWGRWAVP